MDTMSSSLNCTTVSGYLIIDCLATFYEQTINQMCEMNKRVNANSFSMWLGSSLSKRLDFMAKVKFQEIDPILIYAYQQLLVQTLPNLSELGCLEFCQDLQIAYIQLQDAEPNEVAECLLENFFSKDVQFIVAKSELERDKIILGFTVISNLECDYLKERQEFFKELKVFPLRDEDTNMEFKMTERTTNCLEDEDSDYDYDEIDAIGHANIDGEASFRTKYIQEKTEDKIKLMTNEEFKENKDDIELQAKIQNLNAICQNCNPKSENLENESNFEPTQRIYDAIQVKCNAKNKFHPTIMVKTCETRKQILATSQILDKFYDFLNENYLKQMKKPNVIPNCLKCKERAKSSDNVAKQVKFKQYRRKVNGKLLKWLMKQIK